MFKKILSFQSLLLSSDSAYTKNKGKISESFFVVPLIVAFVLLPAFFVLDSAYFSFFFVFVPIQYLYHTIINSESKLYKQVPLSKDFLFFNLFFTPFFYNFIVVTFCYFAGLIINLLIKPVRYFSEGKINLSSPGGIFGMYQFDIKVILFYVLLLTVFCFGFTTVAFIPKKIPRRIVCLIFFIATEIFLALVGIQVRKLQTDTFYYFSDIFPKMSGAGTIVAWLGIFTAVIVPVSILVSYKLFNKGTKHKKAVPKIRHSN